MAWSLCGTIEECRVAAVEAVGSHHTHLGPVSEEYMVFKHSNSKGMWSLGPTIEDYFPGKQQHLVNYHQGQHGCVIVSRFRTLLSEVTDNIFSATITCPNHCR